MQESNLPELKIGKQGITLHITKLSGGYNLIVPSKQQAFAITSIEDFNKIVEHLATSITERVVHNFNRDDNKAPKSITIDIHMFPTQQAHFQAAKYGGDFLQYNQVSNDKFDFEYNEEKDNGKHEINRIPDKERDITLEEIETDDKSEIITLKDKDK